MTLAELRASVGRLGFAPLGEDMDGLVRDAAVCALDEIAAVRPRLVTASLWHLPTPPLYAEGSVRPTSGEKTISLPHGRSYFIRIAGHGRVLLTRDKSRWEEAFHTEEGEAPAVIGGNLSGKDGPLTVSILAEGSYRLLSLAVYDSEFASLPPDPLAARGYDLAALFPAFGALAYPPRTKDGRTLLEGEEGDYTLHDGHILLLSGHAAGEVRITYRKRLSLPEEGELPLSEDEAALLPLFCASYVYLEDDPDKATYYLSRFREGLRRLSSPAGNVHRFCDVLGWG